MAKRRITFDGRGYTVRSDSVTIPDLDSLDRFDALIWLNRNTYATGPRSTPNPLQGLGSVLVVNGHGAQAYSTFAPADVQDADQAQAALEGR